MSQRIVIARSTWPTPLDLIIRDRRRDDRARVAEFRRQMEAHAAQNLEHVRGCENCKSNARRAIELGVYVDPAVRELLKGPTN